MNNRQLVANWPPSGSADSLKEMRRAREKNTPWTLWNRAHLSTCDAYAAFWLSGT